MTEKTEFNLAHFLPYCLTQASEAASLAFRQTYKELYNMTRPEWRVLVHLGQFGEMTASDIVQRSGLHKTKISRAVFALEKRRWLVRRSDANDRRFEHLALTRAGHSVFKELGQAGIAHDAKLLEGISPEEEAVFRAVLEKLSAVGR